MTNNTRIISIKNVVNEYWIAATHIYYGSDFKNGEMGNYYGLKIEYINMIKRLYGK